MWKKTTVTILLIAVLLLLLPGHANAIGTGNNPRPIPNLCTVHDSICQPYICEICGYNMVYTSSDGHDYAVTSKDGCLVTETCNHCGQTVVAEAHDYTVTTDGCYTTETCNRCNQTQIIAEEHQPATTRTACSTTQKCTVCEKQLLHYTHHAFTGNALCGAAPACINCGLLADYTVEHHYITSFFGGFTYCTRCHEHTFSLADVNWFILIAVIFGLGILVAIIIYAIKFRGSGVMSNRTAKNFGLIEHFSSSSAPLPRQRSNDPSNPALALHILKEEDETPKD